MIDQVGGIPLHDNNSTHISVQLHYFNVNMLDYANSNVQLSAQLRNYSAILNLVGINSVLTQACELSGSCIVITLAPPDPLDFVCTIPLPLDCLSKQFREGRARFSHLFSVLPDYSSSQFQQLDLFHQQGVQRIAVFSTDIPSDLSIYHTTISFAEDFELQVVYTMVFPTLAPGAAVWSLADVQRIVDAMRAQQVQAIIFIAISVYVPVWMQQQIETFLQGMCDADFVPQAINIQAVSVPLIDPELIEFTYIYITWNAQVKGLDFKTINSSSSLEFYPAQLGKQSPAVFQEVFDKYYTEEYPPAYLSVAAVSAQSLNIVQKLVELSGSVDPKRWVEVSLFISVPSFYGRIAFDPYGRTRLIDSNQIILQYVGKTKETQQLNTLLPLTVRSAEAIFPTPTWQERHYRAFFFNVHSEQVVAGYTSIGVLICVYLFWWTVRWREAAILKAASIPFLLLFLVSTVMFVASNYFATLDQTRVTCAFQIWLITLGFTGMYGSLFLKSFRVARIFNNSTFSSHNCIFENKTLFLLWLLLMSFDVALNIIWCAVQGMQVTYHDIQEHRPLHNYYGCAGDELSYKFGIVSMTLKLIMVAGGIVCTFQTWNVPDAFNESKPLAVSIWLIALLAMFCLPIVLNDVGGRETVYLIRCAGVFIIGMNSVCLIYIPKWYHYMVDKVGFSSLRLQSMINNNNNNTTLTAANSPRLTVSIQTVAAAAATGAATDNAINATNVGAKSGEGGDVLSNTNNNNNNSNNNNPKSGTLRMRQRSIPFLTGKDAAKIITAELMATSLASPPSETEVLQRRNNHRRAMTLATNASSRSNSSGNTNNERGPSKPPLLTVSLSPNEIDLAMVDSTAAPSLNINTCVQQPLIRSTGITMSDNTADTRNNISTPNTPPKNLVFKQQQQQSNIADVKFVPAIPTEDELSQWSADQLKKRLEEARVLYQLLLTRFHSVDGNDTPPPPPPPLE
jgi:hypothetical protein